MHIITSKFRGLFIGKILYLAIVFTVMLTFSLKYIFKVNKVESQISVNLIIGLAIVLLLLLIYRIVVVMKVCILADRLEMLSFFGNKTEVLFSEILKIDSNNVAMTNKAENSTDGYHYSVLVLKNGKTLVISPDEFENYNEIMAAIISRRNSQNFS